VVRQVGRDREGEYKRTIVKVSKLTDDIKTGGHNYSRDEPIGEPADWVGGVRHRDGASSIQALWRNCGNSGP
jgi:hypothetical protein